MQSFEEVVRRDGAEVALELEKGLVDLVDELGLDGVGQDGVAVLGDALEVVLRGRGGAGAGGRRFGADCR